MIAAIQEYRGEIQIYRRRGLHPGISGVTTARGLVLQERGSSTNPSRSLAYAQKNGRGIGRSPEDLNSGADLFHIGIATGNTRTTAIEVTADTGEEIIQDSAYVPPGRLYGLWEKTLNHSAEVPASPGSRTLLDENGHPIDFAIEHRLL